MSTTTVPTVAGVDAYEHGYTAAYSVYTSHGTGAAAENALTCVVRNLGIDGPALTDWLEGTSDALSDLEDERRRAGLAQ